jgi:hypothetical protein
MDNLPVADREPRKCGGNGSNARIVRATPADYGTALDGDVGRALDIDAILEARDLEISLPRACGWSMRSTSSGWEEM